MRGGALGHRRRILERIRRPRPMTATETLDLLALPPERVRKIGPSLKEELDSRQLDAIRAVLLDPGAVRTKLRAEAFPGEDKDALASPAEIAPMIVALAGAADPGPPDQARTFTSWRNEQRAVAPETP